MEEIVAKKYAQAIFEVAVEEGQLQVVASELERLLPLYRESKKVLLSPTIAWKDKLSLVETMEPAPLVRSFVLLLMEKDRLALFDEIKSIFDRMLDEKEKTATAHVKTAVRLDEKQADELRVALEKSTGFRIKVAAEIDESIIGGMVVRIGDKILDGSVKSKLESMLEKIREIK